MDRGLFDATRRRGEERREIKNISYDRIGSRPWSGAPYTHREALNHWQAVGYEAFHYALQAKPKGVRRDVCSAVAGQPRTRRELFLNPVERVFPGTTAQYRGLPYEDHWALDPWVRGPHSCPLVGQALTLAEKAAEPHERIHFAGERTSVAHERFLEGAVESGERTARELFP